ncbi:MAG: hypothetical protein Fur0037_14370 [Planctomycetota bacterium]
MSEKSRKKSEIGYTAASEELEEILQEIESGEIDLDALSEKVRRAAELIAICREKLSGTEAQVKKIVADLAAAADADSMESGDNDKDAG